MPNLINYLSRLHPGRSFDEWELARLQLVYDRARQELAIDVTDPRRETVAALIFEVAELTSDPEDILKRVVALFPRSN